LIYTGKRISEIAFDSGFNDLAYFSRFFARHAGVSPRDFRKARGGDGPAETE
jgi:AraC-like DNA-binding protein